MKKLKFFAHFLVAFVALNIAGAIVTYSQYEFYNMDERVIPLFIAGSVIIGLPASFLYAKSMTKGNS